MKKKKSFIIIFIIMLIMFFVPTLSYGYDFACKRNDVCNKNVSKSMPGSICGIFHQMYADGHSWLTSTPKTGSGWAGEVGAGKIAGTKAMIYSRGALCFGHRTTNTGDKKFTVYAVIDINENTKDLSKQYLGYAAYLSTKNGETKTNADNKSRIRKWLYDNYSGIIQKSDTNAKKNYVTTESQNYAKNIISETMTTKSTTNTNQTYVYKDGYTFIGPYNLQTQYGNLSKATIDGLTTNLCSIDGVTYKNMNSVSNYNGNNFYIVIAGKIGTAKNIMLYKSFEAISSRVVVTQPKYSGGQNVAIFYGEKTTKEKSISLPEAKPQESIINIKKIDEETNQALNGIGIVVKAQDGTWVTSNPSNVYVSNINQATIFKTAVNGSVTINHLNKTGKYTIYEVLNPNYKYGSFSTSNPVEIATANITAMGQNMTVQARNRIKYANLVISKKDADSGKLLKGVTMVIYNETKRGYVRAGSPATYVSDINQATKYKTSQNGTVSVTDLARNDRYAIYEIANENFGYEDVSIAKPLKLGNSFVMTGRLSQTVNVTNKRVYIKLSGYAWEENGISKDSIKDFLWNNNGKDARLANITVRLKRANGTVIATRTTGSNGSYIFEKVRISDLSGAYIEFEYNGMCYQSIEVKSAVSNGNKATDNALRNTFNNNFATIVKDEAQNNNNQKYTDLKYNSNNYRSILNYGGTYKYGYTGQAYPISGIDSKYILTANTKDASPNLLLGQTITLNDIYKKSIEEIPNINLGLMEREMPDLAIVEDIESAKISLNGYEHTYNYDQRFSNTQETGDGFNVSVKFGNKYGSASYTRNIYSSDVSYNAQEENKGKLEIYLTYKIAIRNEATIVYTKANQIVNYYDDRYDINNVYNESRQKLNWQEDQNYNQNGYKKVTIQNNQNIMPQKQSYVYIEYKLKNDAINALINSDITLNSVTEITSYSSYSDTAFSKRYAGVDRDSNPQNSIPESKNTYEDDTDSAPSLVLNAKETRVIRGTVWEDNIIEQLLQQSGYNKERKGDGIYSSEENVVENVKVELLDINNNNQVATLYKKDETTEEASRFTDKKGGYEFVGVIPGNYLIRYTYGNESVIYKPNGEEVGKVKAEEYKSTIYREGNKTQAETMTDYWYREETGNAKRLSDAKDNDTFVQQRTNKVDTDITYGVLTDNDTLTEIQADTRKFEIKLDYDINLDNISEYGADLKFIFDNIDFGIIRRPIQTLDVDKQIGYVQVVLANGQVLIQGNPKDGNIKHLKYLPDGNIHIEIDNELIQGANLNVNYNISVDNTMCEIDYYDKDYYIYGIIPSDREDKFKIPTVKTLFEYLSKDLSFNAEDEKNSKWTQVDITKLGIDRLSEEALNAIKEYVNVFETDAFINMTPGNRVEVPIVISKLLSNTQDDCIYSNEVEVNILKDARMSSSIPGNYVPGTNNRNEDDDSNKYVTITGPTGEDKNYIITASIGITSLLILGAGIIFIKKKVIDK